MPRRRFTGKTTTSLGAVQVTGKRLQDQQIVILGAGSAGIGVADYLRAAMVAEGLADQEARSHFWIVEKDGLLHSDRTDLAPEQRVYTQPSDRVADWRRTFNGHIGLADVIGKLDATILIGLSTVGGAFTEPIVREMARTVERPIIFPLSNPTVKSEAKADDLMRWTDGRALVASGSPFAPVSYGGRTIPIAQCNNVYIFPAMGLGLVVCHARRVTEGMILAAARALGGELAGAQRPDCSAPASTQGTSQGGSRDRCRRGQGSAAGRICTEDHARDVASASDRQPVGSRLSKIQGDKDVTQIMPNAKLTEEMGTR